MHPAEPALANALDAIDRADAEVGYVSVGRGIVHLRVRHGEAEDGVSA